MKNFFAIIVIVLAIFIVIPFLRDFISGSKASSDKDSSITTQVAKSDSLKSGWERIYINDVGRIDLPPTMEVLSESDEITVSGARIIKSSFIALPKSLNNEGSKYARIDLATDYDSSVDYLPLDLDLSVLNQDQIKSVEIIAHELNKSLKQNFETICSIADVKLISWIPLKALNINGMFGFHTFFKMQYPDGSFILQHTYCFHNNDRMHTLHLSYRESESDYWESDIDAIINSFRITNFR